VESEERVLARHYGECDNMKCSLLSIMSWSRVSIRAMMIICLYAAIGFVALLRPSVFVAYLLYSVLMCLLFASVVGAWLCRHRERAFWIGFAVFGWGFFVLYHYSLPWWVGPPPLLTSRLLVGLKPRWLPMAVFGLFFSCCDAVENLLLASLGGLLGRLFARHPESSRDDGAPSPSASGTRIG
jgi:hypothetical protein